TTLSRSDMGRDHLRVLRNRRTRRRQRAHEDHQQRDDSGEDRTLDEEVEHGSAAMTLDAAIRKQELRHEHVAYFLGAAGESAARGALATLAVTTGFTGAPGRSLPMPSVTTRPRAPTPLSTPQSFPRR